MTMVRQSRWLAKIVMAYTLGRDAASLIGEALIKYAAAQDESSRQLLLGSQGISFPIAPAQGKKRSKEVQRLQQEGMCLRLRPKATTPGGKRIGQDAFIAN